MIWALQEKWNLGALWQWPALEVTPLKFSSVTSSRLENPTPWIELWSYLLPEALVSLSGVLGQNC